MTYSKSRSMPARQGAAARAALLIAASLALPARADDDARERRPASAPVRPVAGAALTPPADVALWREECGACHVVYPPRLLAASDWRQIMHSLDRHFGTDASLDVAAAARIEALLTRSGRVSARAAAAPRAELPRITTQPWFVREHEEIPVRIWKDKRVGSPARCDACHVDAVSGQFDEHRIRSLR